MTELQNEIGLAMVALKKRALDPRAVAKALRERFGVEATVAKTGEPVVFSLEGAEAFVVTLPLPLPGKDMEEAAARSWHWPGASLALEGHRAHAVVTVASPGGTDRLEQALRLTRVVAAVASTEDATAVYWGSAGLLHDPADFLDEIERAGPDYVPVMLWVSVVPFFVKKRKHMATQGLKELGRPEIEVDLEAPLADRIVEFLPDLIAYLLSSGANIQDGDTVGGSATEKFRVRYRKSLRGDERVMSVAAGG
jgi:hypothetical protein